MKLTRVQLRKMILKEFRDTSPGNTVKIKILFGIWNPKREEPGQPWYNPPSSGPTELEEISMENNEISITLGIDRAIAAFEKWIKFLEVKYGIKGLEPYDFGGYTLGTTNEEVDNYQTLVYYVNDDHMQAYPPSGRHGALFQGGQRMYPNNPEYYLKADMGPDTELIMNIERTELGDFAMYHILENYPQMRTETWDGSLN